MGGFDIGSLFGTLNLDDSQYKEAMARSKVGATLLSTELSKLKAEVIALVPELIKAGSSLEEIAAVLGLDTEAANKYVATLSALQATKEELTIATQAQMTTEQKAAAVSLANYNSMIEAERIRTAQLKAAYALEVDRAGLAARLRAEELAGQAAQIKATEAGLAQEAAYRKAVNEQRIASDLEASRLKAQLTQQEIEANILRANEESQAVAIMAAREREYTAMYLGLLEERDAATKAEIAERILLANQYAQAEVQAAAIAKEAQMSTSGLGLRLTGSGIQPRGYLGAGAGGGLLAAGAAAFGLYEIVKITEAAADAARETQNLADKLNISWEQARNLEQGARLAGISIGGLSQSAFHLAEALEDAGGSGRKTAQALESMGVTGSNSGELLLNTLKALSQIGDETQRVDKLHEVFQRQSQALLPYVKSMDDLNKLISTMSQNLKGHLSKELTDAARSFTELGIAWDKFKERIATGPVGKAAAGAAAGASLALDNNFGFLGSPAQQKVLTALSAPPVPLGGAIANKALADLNDQMNRAASEAFRAQHSNIEALKSDLQDVQAEIKQFNADLGSIINPPTPAHRVELGGLLNAALEKELDLKKRIKEASPDYDDKVATKAAKEAAAIEEAQTALARFADAYNASFQLLTDDQRAFIEQSFSNLNQILNQGTQLGNLSTFRASLGKYSESLKEFTAEAKHQLENEKLTEAIDKMTDKFSRAEGLMSAAEFAYLNALLGRINSMVTAGLDPKLIDPFITEFNDKLTESETLGKSLASEAKIFGSAYEKAFALAAKETEAANAEITVMMRNLTALKQLQVTNPAMAAKLEDEFRQSQLRRILGIQDPNTLQQTQNSTLEYLGTGAELRDKQIALIKYFEDVSKASGQSAEQISQDQKIMINGVVQDYDALKDRVKSNLGIVGQAWKDLTVTLEGIASHIIGALGSSLFDTLFPNFTNPKANTGLQPIVDSLRSAYEQLSAYSNPKQALQDLIKSIQQAGSASQANAIAVRYFGNTAGPLLAAELRNGTISASDLSKAIDQASASTQDYATKNTNAVSQLTLLWRQLVKDVTVAIIDTFIKVGLLQLLTWLGIINKSTNSLASALDQVFTRLAAKLVALFKSIGTTISNMVRETAKAVEDAINNIHATATVDIVTHYYSVGDPGMGGGDPGSLFRGNGGFGFPGIEDPWGFLGYGYGYGYSSLTRNVGRTINPGGTTVSPKARNDSMHISGPITVIANDPTTFIGQLKRMRAIQGV
jgi:hypothetical protein